MQGFTLADDGDDGAEKTREVWGEREGLPGLVDEEEEPSAGKAKCVTGKSDGGREGMKESRWIESLGPRAD